MRACLFEERASQFEPISATRPVFALRCGMETLAQKQLRYVDLPDWGALMRPELEDVYRLDHAEVPVNDDAWLSEDDVLLVNGRWLPPRDQLPSLQSSCVGVTGDGIAYVVLKKGMVGSISFDQLPMLLEVWRHTLPTQDAGGVLLEYPWDLIEHNSDEIRRDFAWLSGKSVSAESESFTLLGPRGDLWIAPTARVEPMVMLDTRGGPIVVDEHAAITAFTRLEGPCYVGPHTQVFGAKIRAGTTLGPHCRIGGEVEASIVHGYSNKYHDGFLGHSYVGEWVNLGAGTHNSDLRNDYGEVTVTLRGMPLNTGSTKVGCFLGDHTKTGLGTLLNTGSNVGAFCNLLPAGRFAPKYLPSFTTWWNGSLREAFTLEQLLATAEIAMRRRGVDLTDAHRALYALLLDETEGERQRVIRESEQRSLRRSA